MKTHPSLAVLAAFGLLLAACQSHAAITVPGADGSDGPLNVPAVGPDLVIDLSQAVTGVWDTNNTANAGKGIYDPTKWAVVFKYSSVNIGAGRTVTFVNHLSRAPVVWLVNGDVTINGTVSASGQRWGSPTLAEPGPGGFRGGSGRLGAGVEAAAGFGVGGGGENSSLTSGGAGSYGSVGASPSSPAYGTPSLIPLIGGSGGGGAGHGNSTVGGGAGGGAILIACENTVTIAGAVRANGGNGRVDGLITLTAAPGSGGGIRIVANTLAGNGSITALGGTATEGTQGATGPGGVGRIRIERFNNSNTIAVTPDPSIVPIAAGETALLWPPSGSPEVRIVSIGGVAAPADPRSEFGTVGADVPLPQNSSTQVVIETKNVEESGSVVEVRVTPRSNGNAIVRNATKGTVSGTTILWTATLPVNTGYSAVQVKVVRP